MRSALKVRELQARESYSGFLCALGYESRCPHIAERVAVPAGARVAFGFTQDQRHKYPENRRVLERLGVLCMDVGDDEFRVKVRSFLDDSTRKTGASIAVDVSCMSRLRMAQVIAECSRIGARRRIAIDFLYSPAQYSEAPSASRVLLACGPVLAEFAGWGDPMDSIQLVLGIGNEYDLGVAIWELVEPASAFVFRPEGGDERYSEAITTANTTLLEIIAPERVVGYDTRRPVDIYERLVSFSGGVGSRRARIVIAPLGPKVFALGALLAATGRPGVAVWRCSAGSSGGVDRVATGEVIGLSADWSPEREPGMVVGRGDV